MPDLRRRTAPLAALLVALASLAIAPPIAAAAPSQRIIDEFQDGAWYVADGTATLSTSATARSGSGALKIDYNVGARSLALGLKASPSPLPGLPRGLSIDVYGDHSWNVLYLLVRDATGEIFQYCLGNLDFDGWKTLSISPGAGAPAGVSGGDEDGMVDLPLQLHRIIVDGNNPARTFGAILLDALTLGYEDWSPMRPDTADVRPVRRPGDDAEGRTRGRLVPSPSTLKDECGAEPAPSTGCAAGRAAPRRGLGTARTMAGRHVRLGASKARHHPRRGT